MAEPKMQLVQANFAPSKAVGRAAQIAAAKEKVSFEPHTLLGDERTRCMTGEEALSIREYRVLGTDQAIPLNAADICMARQERSLDFDARLGEFDVAGIGLYSPYAKFMASRVNQSLDSAKFAVANYQAVVEALRTGKVQEAPDKSVSFTAVANTKPLKLIPGLAFDLGFTAKTAAVLDGTETTEKPKRTEEQIRQEALACISNNASNVACYDLGRENANRVLQQNSAISHANFKQARAK